MGQLTTVGAGPSAEETLVLLISDAFTDADSTNLTAHTIAPTNVPSTSWSAQIGTWAITSNKARAATVVSSQAVATVETGYSDIVIEGNLETNGGWVGLVFRYVDANNYCTVRITTALLRIYKRVGGSESQVASAGITYVAGARLVVRITGSTVTATYNGVTTLAGTISDAAFSGETTHGLFCGAAGSVVNIDSLVISGVS